MTNFNKTSRNLFTSCCLPTTLTLALSDGYTILLTMTGARVLIKHTVVIPEKALHYLYELVQVVPQIISV